jgi:hypothetical protein
VHQSLAPARPAPPPQASRLYSYGIATVFSLMLTLLVGVMSLMLWSR